MCGRVCHGDTHRCGTILLDCRAEAPTAYSEVRGALTELDRLEFELREFERAARQIGVNDEFAISANKNIATNCTYGE